MPELTTIEAYALERYIDSRAFRDYIEDTINFSDFQDKDMDAVQQLIYFLMMPMGMTHLFLTLIGKKMTISTKDLFDKAWEKSMPIRSQKMTS